MKEVLVKNAASKKQVDNAKKEEKAEEQLHETDVRQVLGTRSGRNLIWKYIQLCHVFTSSYGDSMAFMEGERNIGLRLLSDINKYVPSAYLKMLEENKPGEKDDD